MTLLAKIESDYETLISKHEKILEEYFKLNDEDKYEWLEEQKILKDSFENMLKILSVYPLKDEKVFLVTHDYFKYNFNNLFKYLYKEYDKTEKDFETIEELLDLFNQLLDTWNTTLLSDVGLINED